MTFTIKTQKQIASDSPDHLCPVGCINDNFSSIELIEEVIQYFQRKQITVLDLGCAGGQFVVDFIERGHHAVGLEGSTHALVGSGRQNWEKYFNKNLFLCDITEEYQLYENDVPLKFDYIHSEEVFEHIAMDKIDPMLQQIHKHLEEDGICSFGISLGHDIRDENGQSVSHSEYLSNQQNQKYFVLHQSVFSAEWWRNKLIDNGFEILKKGKYDNNHRGYIFNYKVRPELGVHPVIFVVN